MSAAFSAKDLDSFKTYSEKFMSVIEDMEKVTGTSEYFLLGRWVEQAKALANNADDFTKELYEFNAKALVTTWGSKNQAEKGGLKDYSNRQWSGLIGDFLSGSGYIGGRDYRTGSSAYGVARTFGIDRISDRRYGMRGVLCRVGKKGSEKGNRIIMKNFLFLITAKIIQDR